MGMKSFPGGDYVGISGTGYYIPEGVMTSAESSSASGLPEHVFSQRIGLSRKHIARDDEHPAGMGAIAAREALADSGVDPAGLDSILFCGLSYYDYRFWSPAAKIQDLLGAANAFAFEVKNGCNGGNLGLELGRNRLCSDAGSRYALVVSGEKLSVAVNYKNPRSLSGFSFADGAAAAVLEKNCPENRILAYTSITDGSLVDTVKIPFGGTRMPPFRAPGDEYDCYLSVDDPPGLEQIFSRIYLRNYLSVIGRALGKSGFSTSDIRFLFMNQVKRSLTLDILDGLGLDESDTALTMRDHGHMGSVDTLYALARAREEGSIRPGDIVVLAGSAIGFTWAALVIEWL